MSIVQLENNLKDVWKVIKLLKRYSELQDDLNQHNFNTVDNIMEIQKEQLDMIKRLNKRIEELENKDVMLKGE